MESGWHSISWLKALPLTTHRIHVLTEAVTAFIPPITHLVLVPGLSLRPASVGNLLILCFDLCNDAVQVQVSTVIHRQYHRGVRDLGLQLMKFLPVALETIPLITDF